VIRLTVARRAPLDYGLAMARLALACLASLIFSIACGGSSSESPWPVEPLDLEPGPVGEGRGSEIPIPTDVDNYGEDASADEEEAEAPEAPASPEEP
jgi:hypothetical protein